MGKRHPNRNDILERMRIEATAFMASGRSVKLIALVILSEEFKFDADQLKTFLERFEDTLDYYNKSDDYTKLLNEWNDYFKETIGEDILKWK